MVTCEPRSSRFSNEKKVHKRFLTIEEFDQWRTKNDSKGYEIKYYKGLGSSSDKDIEDDLETSPTVICFYDSECETNMNLAFHEDFSDRRKEWIEKWRNVAQTDDVVSMDISKLDKLTKAQDISQFINRELVRYSVSSLFRAIPSKYDLIKESQRKALGGRLLKILKYNPKDGKIQKTARFASDAASMSQYHHGENLWQIRLSRWLKDLRVRITCPTLDEKGSLEPVPMVVKTLQTRGIRSFTLLTDSVCVQT